MVSRMSFQMKDIVSSCSRQCKNFLLRRHLFYILRIRQVSWFLEEIKEEPAHVISACHFLQAIMTCRQEAYRLSGR